MSRIAVFFLMIISPALAICLGLLGLETLGKNMLGWILLVFGILYSAGVVINYFIRHEPFWKSRGFGKIAQEELGDRSFWFILPGFLVVFFAPPMEWYYLPESLPRTTPMQVAGLILILAGILIRILARKNIRGLYSGHVEVHENHLLITSGPYKYIRHPGYFGFLLLAFGLAIGYSSIIGLVAVPVLLLPGLVFRLKVEEQLLHEKFGEEYISYVNRTKTLIPFVW